MAGSNKRPNLLAVVLITDIQSFAVEAPGVNVLNCFIFVKNAAVTYCLFLPSLIFVSEAKADQWPVL